jgi:hypothetical protein
MALRTEGMKAWVSRRRSFLEENEGVFNFTVGLE